MLDSKQSLTEYEKPLNDTAEASFTLPSYLYTDPAVAELEKTRIFYNSWQYVSHTSLLQNPGDYVTARICDQNVFVIRGDDGALRAFFNVCQHRAHELLPEGAGNVARAIICPYHAWAFQKDGQLRGAPHAEKRPGFDKAAFSLRPVRLEVFLDCAFVNIDGMAESLSVQAADLEADINTRLPFYKDLTLGRMDTDVGNTRIAAGWKVVVDNYVECYHCEHAHHDFADMICMDSYQHDTFDIWARQLGQDIKADNSAYAVDAEAGEMFSAFWFLWPNTTINFLPGNRQVNFSAIRPVAPGVADFVGHSVSASGAFDTGLADYAANVLMPEDQALCESVQRGLASFGYSQGPIIADETRTGRGEHALHFFHRMVQKSLG